MKADREQNTYIDVSSGYSLDVFMITEGKRNHTIYNVLTTAWIKNFPELANGLVSDQCPTFHAMSTPPGHTPSKRHPATNDGFGSGNGINDSINALKVSGIGALRNTNVATRLPNKYSAHTLAAQ